jgi:S-adenosylmethionine-diacylglycerol 3-amino-3-carboxypropyl transferase
MPPTKATALAFRDPVQPLDAAPDDLPPRRLADRLDQRIFNAIYGRSLVYNACWEDPAVDRIALELGPEDEVLVITSAGCNALDYAIEGPRAVHAVDANPRQNALLDLKLAAIRQLEFDDFFALFGHGFHPDAETLYRERLQGELSPLARGFWDRHWRWFRSRRGSFYFHGLSGLVARGFRAYLGAQPKLRRAAAALFQAADVETQRRIYDEEIAPRLWSRPLNWLLSRQLTMNLLGVPYPQRKLVETEHRGSVAGFIRHAIEYVVRELPLADNYFWRLYFTGRYERDCCPRYLTPEGFAALKSGLAARISTHTCTVTEFLRRHPHPITRFVLLDHMDWMSNVHPRALVEEWQAIRARAAPGARILLRSAQARPAYLDAVRLDPGGQRLREVFRFQDALAASLQPRDRVHTYAGFVIADAPA